MNTYKVELEKSAEELADEIINGVWGCGAERRDNITKKYGETVTCPVCERRIYRANDGEVMKVARGSRQAKVNNHYIQLDSYGRFED